MSSMSTHDPEKIYKLCQTDVAEQKFYNYTKARTSQINTQPEQMP